jgi:hypothetical protein
VQAQLRKEIEDPLLAGIFAGTPGAAEKPAEEPENVTAEPEAA